jgi:hypothetical protein
MKQNLTPLIAVLMLTLGLSMTPASARAKPDCMAAAFPLTLGVGY